MKKAAIAPWTLSRAGYYFDLLAFPAAAAWLAAHALIAGQIGAAWIPLAAAGALAWSLIEYLIHRFAFHGPLAFLHEEHHGRPRAFIGVPSWYTIPAFAAAGALAILALGEPSGLAFMAGLLAGYSAYIVIHDRYHHSPFRPGHWAYGLQQRHNAHHRGGHVNFGVSSPLWDLVFRTRRDA